MLEGDIARRAEELFREACEVNGWGLHELSVQGESCFRQLCANPITCILRKVFRALLQIPPRTSVSKAVNLLRGGSSRVLRQGREMPLRHFLEFPDLEEFLWGKSFWCDGYFAESMGQMEETVIRRYIRDQGKEAG